MSATVIFGLAFGLVSLLASRRCARGRDGSFIAAMNHEMARTAY